MKEHERRLKERDWKLKNEDEEFKEKCGIDKVERERETERIEGAKIKPKWKEKVKGNAKTDAKSWNRRQRNKR